MTTRLQIADQLEGAIRAHTQALIAADQGRLSSISVPTRSSRMG
jgi:hypothetical protein